MIITPYCPVCLIPIRLTSEGKITNPHCDNPKLADKTIVKYVNSNIQKIFPTNTERDKNATDAMYSKIIDKKNYVLALDTQRISNKKECLYFWYSIPKLKSVLVILFTNKKNSWKYALVNTKKSNSWDENIESANHYLDHLYETIQEEFTFTIKANGKKNNYDEYMKYELMEMQLRAFRKLTKREVCRKKIIHPQKTIKRTKNRPEYEILYNRNQTVDDACCVVSIQMDEQLGTVMLLVVY
jgi:hypothetical protein